MSNETSQCFSITPQIFVDAYKGNDAVEFYKTAFGAVEVYHLEAENSQLPMLSELKFGVSLFLVCEQVPGLSNEFKGNVVQMLVTSDVERCVTNAVAAGASLMRQPTVDSMMGMVEDPFGILWIIDSSL